MHRTLVSVGGAPVLGKNLVNEVGQLHRLADQISLNHVTAKAVTWGSIFSGARGVATGASHSLAIREDGSLWAWGSGFAIEPKKIADNIVTVAAGAGSTIALSADGKLWAWDGGRGPRQINLDR